MAKRLAEKYGFALYDDGMHHDEHRQIASPEFQPAMLRKFADWDEYFNRPYREYAQWLTDTIDEDLEMILIDLISKSSGQQVVADIHIPLENARRLVEYDHIVFLVAAPDLVISDYFNRPDHKEILDCIMGVAEPGSGKDEY